MAGSTWAVVFGGPSPEHEISILTGLQAERVLLEGGDEVVALYAAPNGAWFQIPSRSEAKDFLTGAPSGSKELDLVLSGQPGIYPKKGLGKKPLDIDAALLCLASWISRPLVLRCSLALWEWTNLPLADS